MSTAATSKQETYLLTLINKWEGSTHGYLSQTKRSEFWPGNRYNAAQVSILIDRAKDAIAEHGTRAQRDAKASPQGDRESLTAERARLVARLAEIDALLA